MRIVVTDRDPGDRVHLAQTQLFMEFTGQCIGHGFARLDLAARKLPVACIGLAFGAAREQHLAIGPLDHPDGDVDDAIRRGCWHWCAQPLLRAPFGIFLALAS